ncbi:MAG TPA: hypothetical protein DEA63_02085 [Firmicutes bacterium]|nr:hypothetical protein [Bacillota bacterium]
MKYSVAFFDVDWTLYDHASQRFIPSGIEAVKKLERQGTKVFICSARNYQSIRSFGLYKLGIHWSGYISCAGGIAVVGNHYVKKDLVDPKIVRRLCNTASEMGRNLEIITPKSRFLISQPDRYTKEYYSVFKDGMPEVRPYKGQPSTGVLFFGPESDDQELKRRNPGLTYFRFAPYGMDIQINPHIKGEGIAAVLNYLGIPKEEAIGFGDDYQDMSMADACSAFVCMGNGKEEVKKVATLVAPRIEDNGLAAALKKLGCI